jgi:hypothetical protein
MSANEIKKNIQDYNHVISNQAAAYLNDKSLKTNDERLKNALNDLPAI